MNMNTKQLQEGDKVLINGKTEAIVTAVYLDPDHKWYEWVKYVTTESFSVDYAPISICKFIERQLP